MGWVVDHLAQFACGSLGNPPVLAHEGVWGVKGSSLNLSQCQVCLFSQVLFSLVKTYKTRACQTTVLWPKLQPWVYTDSSYVFLPTHGTLEKRQHQLTKWYQFPLSGVVTCGEQPAPMSDDGSDSSSDAEEKEEANAAMAGYSMMMPRLSTRVGEWGIWNPDGSGWFRHLWCGKMAENWNCTRNWMVEKYKEVHFASQVKVSVWALILELLDMLKYNKDGRRQLLLKWFWFGKDDGRLGVGKGMKWLRLGLKLWMVSDSPAEACSFPSLWSHPNGMVFWCFGLLWCFFRFAKKVDTARNGRFLRLVVKTLVLVPLNIQIDGHWPIPQNHCAILIFLDPEVWIRVLADWSHARNRSFQDVPGRGSEKLPEKNGLAGFLSEWGRIAVLPVWIKVIDSPKMTTTERPRFAQAFLRWLGSDLQDLWRFLESFEVRGLNLCSSPQGSSRNSQ